MSLPYNPIRFSRTEEINFIEYYTVTRGMSVCTVYDGIDSEVIADVILFSLHLGWREERTQKKWLHFIREVGKAELEVSQDTTTAKEIVKHYTPISLY